MASQIKLGKERFYNTQFLTIGTCYLPKQLKSSVCFFIFEKQSPIITAVPGHNNIAPEEECNI